MRRGLVESRTAAQDIIERGLVSIDNAPASKAATLVHPSQAVVVAAPARRYVSRGGDKLEHGLTTFAVDPRGRRCLDAGVSTGGFTDCLLQHGAEHIQAFDVGYGQVHDRIRNDPRVRVCERTNVRHLTPDDIDPPAPDLLVADLSFISLSRVLGGLLRLLTTDTARAEGVVLVKPQFEADKGDVGKGGIVRDREVWRRSLLRVAAAAAQGGWVMSAATPAPRRSPAGNVEFLAHIIRGQAPGDATSFAVDERPVVQDAEHVTAAVETAVQAAFQAAADAGSTAPNEETPA